MGTGSASPERPEGRTGADAGETTAVVARRQAGQAPPDVIEVVFPPTAAPGPEGGSEPEADRLRRHPLLVGGLAIVAVGVAAVLAWQLWPQPPSTHASPQPPPVTGQPLLSGGLLAPAAGTPSARPPADGGAPDPTRPPVTANASSAGAGSATTGAPSAGTSTGTSAGTSAGTSGGAPATPPQATGAAARTLRAGDTGSDVTDLQRTLFAQGFTYVSTTGVYDDATVRGVTQAQENRGLTCDAPGVYGPCTRTALGS
jgi:hypothetical protein